MAQLSTAAALFEEGKLQQAERLYRQVLKGDPGNGEALWGLGRVAMRAKHYDGAIALFAKACEALPADPIPLISLGEALNARGRYQDSGAVLKRAASLRPDFAHGQYVYGIHLTAAGEREQAMHYLRKVIALQPDMLMPMPQSDA